MARVVLACAPYTFTYAPYIRGGADIEVPGIRGAASTENFLEILWSFLGCREVSEGAENGFLELW